MGVVSLCVFSCYLWKRPKCVSSQTKIQVVCLSSCRTRHKNTNNAAWRWWIRRIRRDLFISLLRSLWKHSSEERVRGHYWLLLLERSLAGPDSKKLYLWIFLLTAKVVTFLRFCAEAFVHVCYCKLRQGFSVWREYKVINLFDSYFQVWYVLVHTVSSCLPSCLVPRLVSAHIGKITFRTDCLVNK